MTLTNNARDRLAADRAAHAVAGAAGTRAAMKVVGVIVAVLVIAAIAWGGYALFARDDLGDTAEAVLEEPDRFVGSRVTVRGDVESFLPDGFTIGDSTFGDELLVVPADGTELPRAIRLRTGTPRIEATGTVRMVDDSFDAGLGEAADPYRGEPVVIASRIAVDE